MDHLKIIKRSWDILWRYRALWLFGILIALTAGGRMSGSSNSGYQFNGNDLDQFGQGQSWQNGLQGFMDNLGGMEATIIAVIIGIFCLVLILSVVFTFLRYIANTALIRMVNDYEETEERRTIKQGFRMGWSRASWRIFLIDLVINIPVALASLVLLAIILSPLLLWLTDSRLAGILATVTSIGLFFLFILAMLAVSAAIRILSQFFHRHAALENLGVFDAIRAGYALFRHNLKDSLLMWLLLLGIQIVYGIGTLIVGIMLLMIALPLGAIPGFIAAGLGALFTNGAMPWILGSIVALSIIIFVISIPFLLLEGWKEVYLSSSWTLTYRELIALKSASPQPAPIIDNEGITEEKVGDTDTGTDPIIEDIP